MRFRLIYIFVVLVLWLPCSAQDQPAAMQAMDSVVNPQVDGNDALVFDATVIDVGEISEDDAPQVYRFTFTNTGKKPLVITDVTSSCGCAAASFSREPVQAGQHSEISVRYSPKGYPGSLSRNVFVYTNSSAAHPSAKLTLRGFVHPTKDKWQGYRAVMGNSLRAKNNRIVFRDMPRTGTRTERIECVNTGSKPLELKASRKSLPTCLSFHTEPKVIGPGQIADLVVSLDADKLTPQCDKTAGWSILLEGIEGETSQRSLRIEADFIN